MENPRGLNGLKEEERKTPMEQVLMLAVDVANFFSPFM